MKNVSKTVPAAVSIVFLMCHLASAADFGALPKYGPVPEMRPTHLTQAKFEAKPVFIVEANCVSACNKIMQSAD